MFDRKNATLTYSHRSNYVLKTGQGKHTSIITIDYHLLPLLLPFIGITRGWSKLKRLIA